MLFAGIDIGGTSVKWCLMDEDGQLVQSGSIKTIVADPPALADAIRDGQIGVSPAAIGTSWSACTWCDYRAVCSAERICRVREIKSLDVKKMLLAQQEEEEADNG